MKNILIKILGLNSMLCFSIASFAQNTEIAINNNVYQLIKVKSDGTVFKDSDIDQEMIIKKEAHFYKKKINRPVNPIDFGAVGDGINDDSFAFLKMIEFVKANNIKLIDFTGDLVYNLKNKSIQFPQYVVMNFSGSIIKNGTLRGNNTTINAAPMKIFENINLDGYFINTENVFVEWMGTFPNDSNSVDLKYSLEKLNKVFFHVTLNQGFYYTKIGNIDLKSIKGLSRNKTFIEFNTNKDNQHLFHIGKIGGEISERSYDYNELKSVGLVLTSSKKVYNNSLIIVGACHQVKIENVKFIANSDNTSLTAQELTEISKDVDAKNIKANNSIVFDGASEAIEFNNIMTLSDIGVRFKTNTDFVTFFNYISWCGDNGLASVFFDDTTISNVLFTGPQSWCQGLFGAYAKNGTGYNNFINVKFENLRIEQLNINVKKNNKVVGTSFWFGDYQDFSNLVLSNVMLSGQVNGLRFGKILEGKLIMDNINIFYDQKIARDFALIVNYPEDSKFEITLRDVNLPPDINVSLGNSVILGDAVSNHKFSNSKIISKVENLKLNK